MLRRRREAAVEADVDLSALNSSEPCAMKLLRVPLSVPARSGRGMQDQESVRLGRQPVCRDDVAGNCWRGPGGPMSGVEDVDAVRAEVAATRRRRGHGQQLRPPTVPREPW